MTKKQEFISLYLQNHSIRETCRIMQMSEMTAYRMLKNGLREELNRINDELYQSALQDLKLNAKCVDAELIKLIADEKTPPAVKVNAIKAFYDIVNISKITEIENKLNELEI